MRGFPLLNLTVVLLLSAAVAWPLVHRATAVSPREFQTSANDAAAETTAPALCRVALRFVNAPRQVRLLSGSTVMHEWKISGDDLTLEDSVALPIIGGRAEFTVQIDWPENTQDTMAEIRAEPPGLPARTANVWSSGSHADEIVSLTWKGDAP